MPIVLFSKVKYAQSFVFTGPTPKSAVVLSIFSKRSSTQPPAHSSGPHRSRFTQACRGTGIMTDTFSAQMFLSAPSVRRVLEPQAPVPPGLSRQIYPGQPRRRGSASAGLIFILTLSLLSLPNSYSVLCPIANMSVSLLVSIGADRKAAAADSDGARASSATNRTRRRLGISAAARAETTGAWRTSTASSRLRARRRHPLLGTPAWCQHPGVPYVQARPRARGCDRCGLGLRPALRLSLAEAELNTVCNTVNAR